MATYTGLQFFSWTQCRIVTAGLVVFTTTSVSTPSVDTISPAAIIGLAS